jgi:hypothetical protein
VAKRGIGTLISLEYTTMVQTVSDRRALIPVAIFVFWAIVLFSAWTLPLLSRPAQKAPKTPGSDERKQERRKKKTEKTAKEGFSAGRFPEDVDRVLLAGDYEQPPHPGLSPYTVGETTRNYPVFPAGACGTNNLRYWRRPSNGTCPWPELCGAFYTATPQDYPEQPKPPAWNAGIRVNFFESCKN